MGQRFIISPPEPPPVPTPPLITICVCMAGKLGGGFATIVWATNIPSTSQVKWGTSPGVFDRETVVDTTLTKCHQVILLQLPISSTIYFKVVSTTPTGGFAEQECDSFTTGQDFDILVSPLYDFAVSKTPVHHVALSEHLVERETAIDTEPDADAEMIVTQSVNALAVDHSEAMESLPGMAFELSITLNVTGASHPASPIRITTSGNHGFLTGDTVVIANVGGNTNANGTWTITAIAATTFDLDGSASNAAYTSGGTAKKIITG